MKRMIGKYNWVIIGLGWALAIALGYFGFHEYFAATGGARSFWDNLYHAFQLFAMEYNVPGEPNHWALQIARYLAPLTAAYTAILAIAYFFREEIQMLRLRFLRNHTVICGLGRKGYRLAKAFRSQGDRVIIIEQNTANEFLELCREEGLPVLLGNATDPGLLRQAGVDRAEYVISVCGNDGANAEIAMATHDLVRRRRGKTLVCFVHIVDLQLYSLIREREMATGVLDTFRLEFFNVFESGSRVLLQEYPPFETDTKAQKIKPHIAVVGIGRFGESIVVNAARAWWESHAKNDERLRITMIDRQAEMKKESLCLRYPQLEEACELVTEQIDIKDPDFERADFLFDDLGNPCVTMIYVCLDNESQAFSAALTLHHRLRSLEVSIVVRMPHETGLATLIVGGKIPYDSYANLHPFGLFDRTCTPELICGCTYEILAHAIHEQYIANEERKGSTPETNPSMVPWEELPESIKKSNRNQVEYICVKLEAIGCDVAITNEWEVPPFQFTPEEVELMSQMEHERFVTERQKQGFTYAPNKDLIKKTSPTLVEWEQLPEAEKEKDRETVRQISELLARTRFQIYRFRK